MKVNSRIFLNFDLNLYLQPHFRQFEVTLIVHRFINTIISFTVCHANDGEKGEALRLV